ncbi:MAG: hypothetical protein AXW14_10065 [Alteromonas sp. Nap_26]|nr:MAG: hypothetical protein AXW14_10065 [Alteromonas sp. Nap_26]
MLSIRKSDKEVQQKSEKQNLIWLLIEKVFNLFLNFAFFLILARYLGPSDLGQFSVIVSLFFLLIPISSLGLTGIATKEFLVKGEDEQTVFGTVTGIRLVGSILAGLIAVASVLAGVFNISSEQYSVVVMLAFANLSRSLGVIELYYKANAINHYAVIVRLVVLLFSSAVKFLGIYLEWSLSTFLLFVGAEWIAIHLGYYLTLLYKKTEIARWKFSFKYSKQLIRRSLWLVFSGLASYVYLKTDILMIAYLIDEKEVGLYAAATRMSEIWYFVPALIMTVFFPKLQSLKHDSHTEYTQLLSKVLQCHLILAFVIATITTGLSQWLIALLYGVSYSNSSSVIAIQIWALIFVFIRGVYSSWLILESHYKYSLVSHLAGAVTNISLNLFLIPQFGGKGAAIATLIAYFVTSILVVYAFSKTREFWNITVCATKAICTFPLNFLSGITQR